MATKDVTETMQVLSALAKTEAAGLDMLATIKALHDALSYIMEETVSADRDGEVQHGPHNEYEIGRDMRAQAHWAIRKSFRTLYKYDPTHWKDATA